MKAIIQEEAINAISKKTPLDKSHQYLKLFYQTDGCGCVVSGVPILKEIDQQEIDLGDIVIETEPSTFSIVIEQKVEWAYDENLIIDYTKSANSFQLKSPNQMLNPRMLYTAKERV